MPYRFYILDQRGGFTDVVEAVCAGDDEALRRADALRRGSAVEVWQLARFVSKVERCAA